MTAIPRIIHADRCTKCGDLLMVMAGKIWCVECGTEHVIEPFPLPEAGQVKPKGQEQCHNQQ
jgi:uncharacterized OB-fold protein